MRKTIIATLGIALMLPACGSETPTNEVEVNRTGATTETTRTKLTISAWVRLPARPDLPAAGYFDAVAEGKIGALLSVKAEAGRVEMHETMKHGNMGSMEPIGGAAFEQGRITFAPGGKHLMIYGLAPALKPGDTLTLVFDFAGQDPTTVEAGVIGPGDPEPDGWRLAR